MTDRMDLNMQKAEAAVAAASARWVREKIEEWIEAGELSESSTIADVLARFDHEHDEANKAYNDVVAQLRPAHAPSVQRLADARGRPRRGPPPARPPVPQRPAHGTQRLDRGLPQGPGRRAQRARVRQDHRRRSPGTRQLLGRPTTTPPGPDPGGVSPILAGGGQGSIRPPSARPSARSGNWSVTVRPARRRRSPRTARRPSLQAPRRTTSTRSRARAGPAARAA